MTGWGWLCRIGLLAHDYTVIDGWPVAESRGTAIREEGACRRCLRGARRTVGYREKMDYTLVDASPWEDGR